MSSDNTTSLDMCAACGKKGDNGLKMCNNCKKVKYCGSACQRKSWPDHKAECKRLHDEALFKPSPPKPDCPICFLRLPHAPEETRYQVCCGNTICLGCSDTVADETGNFLCPFCRKMSPKEDKEALDGLRKRIELNDPVAAYYFGCKYHKGTMGLSQDSGRALELFRQALQLGNTDAHFTIGEYYFRGYEEVGGKDMKKAKYHWEQAAMGGHASSRHNLGAMERNAGNTERSIKHFKIAAEDGYEDSMNQIYTDFVNREMDMRTYYNISQAHDKAEEEIKSEPRERTDRKSVV